eukprot:TRINITY_DN3134_c1_g1_i1.p1 TRINITY_DN3134_c1_g1~~TRINITY_DN3134_c1_g1_i1.p1  ORF type:complete len:113 (+),score=12.12 TRINITY_DN3134_c1_g1_i1:408-746(+)
MFLPRDTPTYAYCSNGTMYSQEVNGPQGGLPSYQSGTRIGIYFDATLPPPQIAFQFFINGKPSGALLTNTGKWAVFVGLYRPEQVVSIVKKPEMPAVPSPVFEPLLENSLLY